MGMIITFIVFGLPLIFIFWAGCSTTVGGSFLGGLILMILIIVIMFVIAIKMAENDPEYLKRLEKRNEKFMEEVRTCEGTCFSFDDGKMYLFFNSTHGYFKKHYIINGISPPTYFRDIEKCELGNKAGVIKTCTKEITEVSPNSETRGFYIEIRTKDDWTRIKSDDKQTLEKIFDVTEYIITKGRSMETSPFSK